MFEDIKTTCRPQYKLLTEDQIRKIHLASLEILANIGVQISHEEGLQLLKEKCWVINRFWISRNFILLIITTI